MQKKLCTGCAEHMKNYMKTKIAIGCLVQWYECDIIEEYLSSLRKALDAYDGEVIVDFAINKNTDLEKPTSPEAYELAVKKIHKLILEYIPNRIRHTYQDRPYTIADYRRTFNSYYCDKADVLVWGESDMLVPSEMFVMIDALHTQVTVSKYIATFATCKMWDASWKPLEHPAFTDKPFIENDYDNWWSLKYTMSYDEMQEINGRTDSSDVITIAPHKFNGCGLVISSEVIKAGVNIPQSIFFVHEDTAFMLMMQRVLGNVPQYHFRDVLLVHNRNHPEKRNHVAGESGDTMNQKRRSNEWYVRANQMCEQNAYNMFDPNFKSFSWEDVWK